MLAGLKDNGFALNSSGGEIKGTQFHFMELNNSQADILIDTHQWMKSKGYLSNHPQRLVRFNKDGVVAAAYKGEMLFSEEFFELRL